MIKHKISPTIILRLGVSLLAIILPLILLIKGIYSSFLYTFSIPLIWQVSFLGKPFTSLGFRGGFFKILDYYWIDKRLYSWPNRRQSTKDYWCNKVCL